MAAKQPENKKEQKLNGLRKTGESGQPAANDAAKFRLYPDEEQYNLIARTFGCVRYYWNLILDLALITYEDLGYSLIITPKEAKQLEGLEFLNEVDSLALSNVHSNYCQAWQQHREHPAEHGKPTWKKRNGLEASYTTNSQPKWDAEAGKYIKPGTIRIENGKIQLPVVGLVDIRQHYELPEGSIIKNATVSRDCAGRVFVSIGYYNPELAKVMAEEQKLDFEALMEEAIAGMYRVKVTPDGYIIQEKKESDS